MGYEDGTLVKVVQEKTRRYRDRLLAQSPLIAEANLTRLLLALKYVPCNGVLNVLDFGGACGAHYFEAKALFGDALNLRWHVVETPAMAEKGREAFESDELKFFSDLESARHAEGIDLTFSSGCLQYLPSPHAMLEALIACNARFIYLTRVGLTLAESDLITIQRSMLSANGPGPMPDGFQEGIAECPLTISSKQAFEATLQKKYDLHVVFEEHKGIYMIQGNQIPSLGYLGKLRP